MIKSQVFHRYEGVEADRPEGFPYPRMIIAKVGLYMKFKTRAVGDEWARIRSFLSMTKTTFTS